MQSARRQARCANGFVPSLPNLPGCCRSTHRAGSPLRQRMAGIKPNISVVSKEAVKVKNRVGRSKRRPSPTLLPKSLKAKAARSNLIAKTEPRRPAPPPAAPMSKLSASICRSRRKRAAPTAALTANSCTRAAPRASSIPAIFAQAINNTKLATVMSTITPLREF